MADSAAALLHREVGRRARQVGEALTNRGTGELFNRIRGKVSRWIRPRTSAWDVLPEDVLRADLSSPSVERALALADGEPIIANWVTGPATAGSGGHTTIFRMMNYLEGLGYQNRLYFYDPFGGDHKYYEDIARTKYGVTCRIERFRSGMDDAHAVIATNWPSAYAVFNAKCAGKRFYFVQDYEPYFYPVGTNSALAENTYRMGFHGITAGKWLANKLHLEFGMTADWFPFGCDVARYQYHPSIDRRGVAFYARAGTPRRAVELGLLALELFVKRHPQIELHLFGEDLGRLPFRYVNHGVVSPDKLSVIYNKCLAGLSLSMTNVSLVPYEMLACGCIPVVNDAEQNRLVLENPYVRYAPLSPHGLADALHSIVTMSDFAQFSKRAAMSIASTTWEDASRTVDGALRRGLQCA